MRYDNHGYNAAHHGARSQNPRSKNLAYPSVDEREHDSMPYDEANGYNIGDEMLRLFYSDDSPVDMDEYEVWEGEENISEMLILRNAE